jgi:replication-associated recombination protein RarA
MTVTPVKKKTTNDDPDVEDDTMFMPHTPGGHPLDEVISAIQKAVRRGREHEALYFTREMIAGGFVRYFWRRLMIIASEEVSGDLALCAAIGQLAANAERNTKAFASDKQECVIEFQAVLHLCRAAKSREACDAAGLLYHSVKNGVRVEPHSSAIDAHTRTGRSLGKSGKDFRFEGRYVAGVNDDDPRCRNDYEPLMWGERQPYLARPEELNGEPDVVLRPLVWNLEKPDGPPTLSAVPLEPTASEDPIT